MRFAHRWSVTTPSTASFASFAPISAASSSFAFFAARLAAVESAEIFVTFSTYSSGLQHSTLFKPAQDSLGRQIVLSRWCVCWGRSHRGPGGSPLPEHLEAVYQRRNAAVSSHLWPDFIICQDLASIAPNAFMCFIWDVTKVTAQHLWGATGPPAQWLSACLRIIGGLAARLSTYRFCLEEFDHLQCCRCGDVSATARIQVHALYFNQADSFDLRRQGFGAHAHTSRGVVELLPSVLVPKDRHGGSHGCVSGLRGHNVSVQTRTHDNTASSLALPFVSANVQARTSSISLIAAPPSDVVLSTSSSTTTLEEPSSHECVLI